MKITAFEVRQALIKRFSDHRRYAVAEEVGLTTGFSHRRLDFMVLDCYDSNGFRIDGFEIKVSTNDLRRELEDPEKHIAFFDVIDYYSLAVPAGVVDPLIDIIPKKWGILIINEDGSTRYRRKPLALEDVKADRMVPRGFLAAITRSIQSRQPSEQELRNAYSRGFEDGTEKADRHNAYMNERLANEAKKLEEYDKLQYRFRLYGDKDIDRIMDQFEAFRKLDPEWAACKISDTIGKLNEIKRFITGGKE